MDNKGFISIFDGLIAIFLLLLFILIISSFLAIPISNYSIATHDSRTSQDIMESLSTKINYTDTSFLEEITQILESNNNSKRSINQVSKMVENELNLNRSYVFKETNILNQEIASNGDITQSDSYTVASRSYKGYNYILILYD